MTALVNGGVLFSGIGVAPWVAAVGLALGLIASSGVPALAETGSPKGDVHKLSHDVEKLIKIVEGSTLACQTRNAVVRRLRKLNDALLSGRLAEARLMALAWRQNAWSLEAARVLSPEVGSAVQVRLGGLADQLGTAWAAKPGPTKHWQPLPSCDTAGVVGGRG